MATSAPPTGAAQPRRPVASLRRRWSGLSDRGQVGACLVAMGGALGLWVLFWPVPTEVMGQGVLIYPDNAGLLDARAGGQVRRLRVAVGQEVRKGQVLMELYLPVLDRQLQQQRGNLAQLERDNRDLDRRDALRLSSERLSVDTALAKLAQDRRRYEELAATYAEKVRNLRWLSKREVVAPLASEVVAAEQGLTSTSVSLDAVRIQEKELLTRYEQVRLDIQTQALRRRYQIDDMRRQIRVTEARLAFDGQVLADRDGTVLDLQVIQGQTVATGQRLGTLGRAGGGAAGGPRLQAVAYFAPADARRLPAGLPVEVVPLWDQRGRFGGIVGKVVQVLALPATEEDISTTIGNPQLARDLLKHGPVMRTEIALERDSTSRDGYRWTLSGGSGVFPVREGLTIAAHAYVEWRTPITYVIPGLRSLTGGYRSLRIDRLWDRPSLRQSDSPP
ncbi:NHLP bacteriocin system secretion protein [Cyanobium gracile UHCC 0139]|uniref:NHLP bacteriocin system secretion protein n=1 Tax=Cyanobium gracile UHCC 0139 TaxID=3110308 RepID=A0ABU5RXD8_9CYAN|nr:NHLP bacteriocin system secretion protein [Cyanobium gracile]MEA5392383.1 NHLP bacteriocin system secretion protein [Cyanobium gracile UHCC 0139]